MTDQLNNETQLPAPRPLAVVPSAQLDTIEEHLARTKEPDELAVEADSQGSAQVRDIHLNLAMTHSILAPRLTEELAQGRGTQQESGRPGIRTETTTVPGSSAGGSTRSFPLLRVFPEESVSRRGPHGGGSR